MWTYESNLYGKLLPYYPVYHGWHNDLSGEMKTTGGENAYGTNFESSIRA